MKIIAGVARGRRLETLPGEGTRPTQGKVKEALFSALTPWLPHTDWLDLFAGSGAIGLEAASRGARRVVLVEQAPAAVRIIDANIQATKLLVECLPMEARSALARLEGNTFDVIFLDPPYGLDATPIVESLDGGHFLKPGGRLVWEHDSARHPPDRVGRLSLLRTRRYSGTSLSFYSRLSDVDTPER
ncbi:MAG: 16S rRNA (guanine(966)-N(2))-methyltransferase RsmD [Candidatus Sericytochromatia bacterium]|nr:16S rRNA (guanine(966)-N(2))-methyltransferase RsmD [Candidatus Sericytochromatia bacterium]